MDTPHHDFRQKETRTPKEPFEAPHVDSAQFAKENGPWKLSSESKHPVS